MRIIRNPGVMQRLSQKLKKQGQTIGFVPTMGALHAGHVSLIRTARSENDTVIVSIFVNPLQFGPREDFLRYPRQLQHDTRVCQRQGVGYVFAPSAHDMYPLGFRTRIEVRDLSDVLCGAFRPGHFQGMACVVAKLLNIVAADKAYFGQKDAQQAVIIQRMVVDLNMPVKIRVMPIVRDRDGLPLSSRNRFLNPRQRNDARVLYIALQLAKRWVLSGVCDAGVIVRQMKSVLKNVNSARIDYVAVVDPATLQPLTYITDQALIVLAVWIGKTRLIDNTLVHG
jgi:pantoate--beta-alanine ligase